jgi:UDP-N-acetylglucosamine:LPS N-acetylglucosamine transferase
MWFLVKNQNFIVFSKGLKERIIKKGRGYTVQNFPFILDEKFSSSLSQDDVLAAKQKLGYKQDKKVVLILGGGDGIPKGEKILEEILKSKLDAEIGFVCGKNEVLFSGAEKLKLTYNADNLKIYGYVDYIYNLISISNVVITKCGASTIMEILNLKKVPIVNDYIWEQELGNVDYLIENNLGIYEPQIKNLPKAIKQLLEDDSLYSLYVKNISDQKIENGVAKVSSFLINE